jgi:hypothetical protein
MPRHPVFDVFPEQIPALGNQDLRLRIAELSTASSRLHGVTAGLWSKRVATRLCSH